MTDDTDEDERRRRIILERAQEMRADERRRRELLRQFSEAIADSPNDDETVLEKEAAMSAGNSLASDASPANPEPSVLSLKLRGAQRVRYSFGGALAICALIVVSSVLCLEVFGSAEYLADLKETFGSRSDLILLSLILRAGVFALLVLFGGALMRIAERLFLPLDRVDDVAILLGKQKEKEKESGVFELPESVIKAISDAVNSAIDKVKGKGD